MENGDQIQPPKPFHHSHHGIYLAVLLMWALAAALLITLLWHTVNTEMEENIFSILNTQVSAADLHKEYPREKPPAQTVKGLYLTAYSANNPEKLDSIIKLIDTTELNAVVLDIKDYTGYVLYDSDVPLVNSLGTEKHVIKDLPAVIAKLRDHGIYTIARQTVFQDPILAEKKPEWSLASKSGGVWRDHKGLSWVDAARPEVWKYNISIAKEAAKLGFDEINLDYVRFPSDGNMNLVAYSTTSPKYQTMGRFYSFVGEELKDVPAWISLDFFGLTMDAAGTNDLGIGQRIVDAVDSVDYIAPMMYPSHYPSGYAGLKNPAEDPATVFATGLAKGMPLFAGKRAKVRPWIQAFNIGAVYDGAKIRAQIDEIEKYTDAGWLVWNAANRYSADGLKIE